MRIKKMLILLMGCLGFLSACSTEPDKKTEKISEKIKKELFAAADCYQTIYASAQKGKGMNPVLDKREIHRIVQRLGTCGYSAACMENDCDMQNGRTVEKALRKAEKGGKTSAVFFCITRSGGIHRYELKPKGKKAEFTDAYLDWDKQGNPAVSYVKTEKVSSFRMTEKGWLIWETIHTENEEMDTHSMIRIRPLSKEYRRFCRRYIEPVGYRGNNLFLTDWDEKQPGKLYMNDLYEYLYRIETGRYFDGDNGTKGILSEEFELLLQKYLPFSKRQIRALADRGEDGTRYLWEPLRCGNLIPQSMPVPEVIRAEYKKDGRIILTVDAVLKQKGTDCLFRHKVTLKKSEDGRVRYIKNQIRSSDKERVLDYQKRNR